MKDESNNYFFREGINVLSLFDGMSCGQIALERCGIQVNNYFASEIDKYAIQVTQENYPKTKQIGDVCGLQYEDGALFHHQNDNPLKNGGSFTTNIDLLYGGSPCQGFSFSGKQLNFEDPRSKLFFEFVRLVKEVKPNYWMLENVKMKKEYRDVISKHLGVEPIEINSNLVSAQNRPRLYWSNFDITQPKDKGIILKDIIENNNINEEYLLEWKGTVIEKYILSDTKNITFTERRTEEAKRIRREYRAIHNIDFSPRRAKELTPRTDNKMNCLTATFSNKEHTVIDNNNNYRKLMPIEFERLQTITDNYTSCVSKSQRYKIIGNGWTVDVIVDIFNQMVLQKPTLIEKIFKFG